MEELSKQNIGRNSKNQITRALLFCARYRGSSTNLFFAVKPRYLSPFSLPIASIITAPISEGSTSSSISRSIPV
ncbi:hypothetical protein LguiB_024040 [Lonicera macranthoides]